MEYDVSQIIEITDFSIPELDIYARHSEQYLKHYHEPGTGIFVTESPRVIERACDAGYEPISFLAAHNQLDGLAAELFARFPEIPVYIADFDALTKHTGYQLIRGMLCAMWRRKLPSIEEVCKGASRIAVLEDVTNPTNVGAIFRSAAALNMDAVLLTSDCSDPLYRRATRVSMGNVFLVPWTFFEGPEAWPEDGLARLRRMGFQTAAMALKEDSIRIDDPVLMQAKKLAIVLGAEGDGLAGETIAQCDHTVLIPMSNGVDSLNVAAASAVAFWQLTRKQ